MIAYKYWVFYLLPQYYEKFENILPVLVDPDTYIYAYTDNKDFADMFETMHNMKYFRRRKFNMTREQVHELTLTERNKYMKMQSYATSFQNGVTSIDMIVTMEEIEAVEASVRDQIMKCSLKMELEDPMLFSNGLLSALTKLRYTKFWDYREGKVNGSPFDSITFCMSMDELSVYTSLFGVLLKGGEN